MKKLKLTASFFLVIILVSLAVAPAIALDAYQRNLLLIGVMLISPIIIISYDKFYKSDIWLIFFMLSIVLLPLANHPESIRWSTVLYTLMFGLTYLAYKKLLNVGSFTIDHYKKLIKYLIYAYFIVLVIQQFCVLTGLPIFNVSNYHPEYPWKLNSLASEPSHSARIVALLMYCYIIVRELIEKRAYSLDLDFNDDRLIWLAFLWTMLTMGSATAFLFITMVLLKFIKFINLAPLFIIFIITIFLVDVIGITAFERTYKTVIATLTLDPAKIFEADGSAAFRIVPMIILADMVDLTTFDGWFGHGIDYVGSFLSSLIPGLPEGWTGGGLLQLWIDYGFIPFMLFMIFNFSNIMRKGDYLSIAFWFMLVFIQGINNQILWLTIVLLFTNKFFEEKYKKKNEK
jgi:hypothetical protein